MARFYIGVDIGASALRAVLLRRHKGTFAVAQCRTAPFSLPTFCPSALAEEQSIDKKRLIESLTHFLEPFAGQDERISLSLPESMGRLVLTEVDTLFSSRKEGREFLRWRLKKQLPLEPADIYLDYQILKQGATSQQLLISMMSRRVVEDLEEAFEEAGFFVTVIDFHALHCFNYYTPIFEGANDFSFICYEDGILTFFYFAGRTLSYYRSRAMAEKGDALFHEIQRSIIDCRNHHGAILQNPLYFHGDADAGLSLFSSLNSFFSGRTVFLDAGLEKFFQKTGDFPPDLSQSLAAAVGAAQRLMADR